MRTATRIAIYMALMLTVIVIYFSRANKEPTQRQLIDELLHQHQINQSLSESAYLSRDHKIEIWGQLQS